MYCPWLVFAQFSLFAVQVNNDKDNHITFQISSYKNLKCGGIGLHTFYCSLLQCDWYDGFYTVSISIIYRAN